MIIGLTGGMACGKLSVLKYLTGKEFIGFTFSDILNDELIKMGIPITRKSQQDMGNEIRFKEGSGGLARRLIKKFEKGKNYVIDGVRNPGEIIELRKETDFFLIAIESSQELRFERIINRGMERDPKTWEEFLKADKRDFDDGTEYGLQIGKCMKIADFTIVNDKDMEDLKRRVDELMVEIKKSKNYNGVVIEESLGDKGILEDMDIKIISTKIEKVTEKHKTPWVKQWTLHKVEIFADSSSTIADKISKTLDKEHNWYADFKNNQFHYIIFRNKMFKIDIHNQEEYDKAREYGVSLGIPDYQVNFKARKRNLFK